MPEKARIKTAFFLMWDLRAGGIVPVGIKSVPSANKQGQVGNQGRARNHLLTIVKPREKKGQIGTIVAPKGQTD